jgi:Fe-S cluster assembly ATP-binding protein
MHFRGRRLNELPMHERARLGITLAWQEPARFEGLRVRDYLSLGRTQAEPAKCLASVGLEPEVFLDRAVDKTLSGGERKRIELAAILALKPPLAILDEPAAGIDLLSIEEIAGVIHGLKCDGTTVLLITHQQEIVRIADRASYLCGGRIILTGAPQAVAEQFRTRRCLVCDGKVCRDATAG